jgi:hypothetical protein
MNEILHAGTFVLYVVPIFPKLSTPYHVSTHVLYEPS